MVMIACLDSFPTCVDGLLFMVVFSTKSGLWIAQDFPRRKNQLLKYINGIPLVIDQVCSGYSTVSLSSTCCLSESQRLSLASKANVHLDSGKS